MPRLLSVVLVAALAAPAAAGEIRGRVLVDGRAAAAVTVSALPFEDGFATARREARREGLPAPLGSTTTRADGTFAVTLAAPSPPTVRLAFSGGAAAPRILDALFDSAGEPSRAHASHEREPGKGFEFVINE